MQPDAASEAFLAGAARGEFLIVQDTKTGRFHEPQFDVTQDTERCRYVPAAGSGKVISWSIVHERDADSGTDRRPVGIVKLAEGPWWWTELVGANPEADLFELAVRVGFQQFDDGSAFPYFRPA